MTTTHRPYIPAGCDQQGRVVDGAHAASELLAPNATEDAAFVRHIHRRARTYLVVALLITLGAVLLSLTGCGGGDPEEDPAAAPANTEAPAHPQQADQPPLQMGIPHRPRCDLYPQLCQ